jgi:hypothetical protein
MNATFFGSLDAVVLEAVPEPVLEPVLEADVDVLSEPELPHAPSTATATSANPIALSFRKATISPPDLGVLYPSGDTGRLRRLGPESSAARLAPDCSDV